MATPGTRALHTVEMPCATGPLHKNGELEEDRIASSLSRLTVATWRQCGEKVCDSQHTFRLNACGRLGPGNRRSPDEEHTLPGQADR